MTSRPGWLVAALVALALVAWAAAVAGPGSGSASITPSATVAAGATGEWSIQFTAAEPMQNGRVRVTIPAGWTQPQSGSSTSAGYVTVSTNEPSGTPLLSVGGQVVTIDVDTLTVGNTVTLAYGNDAGGASARASAATTPGSYTFVVASDPTGTSPDPLVTSPALSVVAAAPSYIEVAPADTSVTAGAFAEYVLIVRDEFGNRTAVSSQRTVLLFPSSGSFYPLNHSAPITQVNIASGKTSVRVDYRGTLATAAGTPHTLNVFTSGGSPSLGGFTTVHIVPAALSTTASTVAAASPVTANGSSQSAVTVTARDSFGNPREGDAVVLAVTGSAVKADPGSATDENGEAVGAVTNTVAQPVTVSATVNGQALVPTAPILFVAGPVSAATSLVAATTPVIANGFSTSTVTVTAKDANGNVVAGQTVTLSVAPPGGGAVLTQPAFVTNVLGIATGTLTSTTIGPRTVSAEIGATSVTDDAVVNFTAGPVASFGWTGIDGAAVAGVAEPVTITAKDAQGNVITNYTGTVNLTTNSTGVGDAVVQWSSPDALGTINNLPGDDATYTFAAGDNGVATLRVTDTKAETILLTASGPASGVSSSIGVAPGAPDEVQLVAGNGQSASVDTPVATPPKVKVVDAFDNAVTGATVTFTVLAGGGSRDVTAGGGADATGVTATDGTIDCDVWRLGTDTSLNPNQLSALIASGSTPSVDFSATATAGPGANLVLTPGSKFVTVNSNEQVTATLTDSFGNLKSGEQVTVIIKSGLSGTLVEDPIDPGTTSSLNPQTRQGTTDAAGKITVRYVAPAGAGLADVLDASTPNVAQSSVADVTYTTNASGATNLRITFVGSSTQPAGTAAQFTIEAVDGLGNRDTGNTSTVTFTPEGGSGLGFSLTNFGGTITQAALVSGVRTIYVRGTLAGSWDITASTGGLGGDTDVLNVTDTGAIASYDVSTVAGVVAGASFNVSVSARDQYGNLVDGANSNITLAAIDDVTTNPASSTLLVTSASLSSGQATVGEQYTRAEAIRVRVTDGSSNEGTSGIVTVTAAAAKRIAKISGDGTGIAAGSNRTLTAQVLDPYDNPVAGQTVTFTVLQGGGSVLPLSTPSLANGNAATTLTTGVVAGNNRVRASIDDGNPALDEQVEFSVVTTAGGIAYFTVVPQTTSLTAGQTVPLTITAYDAGNNVVSSDNITQVQLSSSTGNAQFGATPGTLTAGVFATTLRNDVVQNFTVTADRVGGGPTGTSVSIGVTNAGTYQVANTSGNGSGITAGATRTLQATVRDLYNNVVPGALVTFSVLSAPDGTAFFTDADGDPNDGIAVANASGVAQVTYHTALTAGANQVNAQILDGSPAGLEKTTFTVNTVSSGATRLRITFTSATTVAANQSFSFKVEALDGSDNLDTANSSTVTMAPEGGSGLLFSATDFGSTTTTFALAGGTRTIFGRGTLAGNWDITASALGLTGDTDAVTITHTGVVASYFVSAAASAAAGSPFTVNIEARDTYGNQVTTAANVVNLVAVDDVTTATTGVPFSVLQANLVAGAVTVNQSYTRAELIRVRARDAGSFEGYSGVVNITPAPAYRVTNLTGDASGIIAGATRSLTARVLDAYDNPVQGQLVSFSAISGGGSAAPPSGSTNSSGDVQTTLTTGTVAGTNIARATILDGTPASLETDDFTVSTVAGPIANYEVTTAKTALIANELTNVTIRARDANGNYRTLDNSTNITISHTGSAILGATSGTLSAGQFATTVRNTVAETFTVSAQTQSDTENGTSPLITVTNGTAFRVVEVSGDAASVPVGIVQPLRTEVQDQWGNTVANQAVRYLITSSPAGAFLGDAVADTADGITSTLANGRAVVRLHTSSTVGTATVTATILDGNPSNEESKTFTVTTVAGGIAYYLVAMSSATTTAGVSKTATITAYDTDDNVVNDDVTQVTLAGDPGIGLVFGANPVTLNNGVAATSVTANLVQTYRVRASTLGNPSITGLGPEVTVVPAAPAGAITATATQTTITANGTSTTAITSGIIRDAFTNPVAEGLVVNVSANNGGVIVGGGAKTIDATGRITFQLQSSNTPATSRATMTSATGSATGFIDIVFAPKPALACNTPVPAIVVPGSSVAFSVQANNTSPTAVNLTTATTFSFTDGTRTYTANLAAPQAIPGSGNVTLVFGSAAVNASFTTASYAPVVTLIGTDAYLSPVNVPASLPAASLLVTSIEITGIVPAFRTVSRGQASTVAVTVKNNGSQPAVITDVDLVFIPGGAFTFGLAPELGQSIGAGASRIFNVPINVQVAAPEGPYQIDAVASGTVGGQPVLDNDVAPYPRANITVQTAASLVYVPGTLSPTTVSRGDVYAFQLSIENQGSGNVLLDSALTRLTFTDGTRTYSGRPTQPFAIAGGATQTVTFRSRAVSNSFVPGSYNATFAARGTENGASFTQDLLLSTSPVVVQTPAQVTASGEVLLPDTVSKTTTATFTVQVQNIGGASVVLTPATTTIRFASNQYSAALNPTGPVTLPPGTTTLQFLGATVSGAIAPANYFPTVQLTGTENGTPFSQSIVLTDDVVVENAPSIAILNIIPSQAQFTTDQTRPIKVRMVVRNNNGATANFTAASIRFIHAGQERTNQFVISTPGTFQGGIGLTSGETDTVLFNVSDNAGPMTAGNMTIEGELEVEDVNTNQPVFADTDIGGKGNLMVMTPAAITFDAVIPSQTVVTQGMARDIKVRAVVRNTGGSEAVLTLSSPTTRINFTPSPGWVVTTPATLAGGGATLSAGELDTLIFNVTTSGSTPGPTNLDVVTSGIETNSGRSVPGSAAGLANLLVETPGSIQVVSVVPSQSSITGGETLPWTVTVTLTNPGGSDVNLALGGNVGLSFQNSSTAPVFTVPGALAGGGTLLSAGETDQLVIPLTTTGTYSSLGTKNITVDVDGTELNSGLPRNGNDTGTVLVQQQPDAAFVSLTPGTVSKLTNVAFAVTVTNPAAPNRASMTLDRSLSRLRFGSNQYNVGLALASPVDIAAGAQVTLQFTGATVGAGIPTGVQADAQLELHWTHNGVADTETIAIPAAITVQNAPSLSIVSVRPSRTTLTRQQSPATTVTMVVRNSGGANVDLNLSTVTTYLGFKVLGSGATVTPEYTIQAPAALEFAGGTVLAGGATDSLVFGLTQAGVTTGSIIVNGYVGGIDLNSSLPVSDDTFDGGSGAIVLQLPGALSILSITPAQATATVGQTTGSYAVKMAVRNTGGAAIDVSLSPANSNLSFPGTSGWLVSPATMPSGVTLTGGETDTLRFTVTTTGGPAGAATIAGNVSGIENNQPSVIRGDDTASGGTGAITLQTPASLIVDSVTPSQPSVTASTSAVWTTTIALRNTGQSNARLTLPAGFAISIQDATGGTSFVKPVDLEEGGVILAGGASGTLVANTTATGTFSTLGNKTLNVTVGATEVNSNRALSAPGAGAVLVQSTPNLVVTAVRPSLVTSESVIDFEVDVQNPGVNAATARLDRGDTRVHFASNAFSAFLDVASADSIAGGQTVTLRFEGKIIPASIAAGPYNFNVNLDYTHNGITRTELEAVTNGVTVQAAPQLAITQILVSQPTVTAGQGADWTATMTVENNGAANIDLDLSRAKTLLTFIGPGGQPDNTYQWSDPVMVSGDDILLPAETGQILFTVTQTGTQTGNIVISGRVEGRDLNQLSIVTDDTFDGGRGGIVVQNAPGVAITATRTSQPVVTVGQTGWSVRVVVANAGGADVAINLGTAAIAIAGGGWTFGPATLIGGGNVLEGGAVDSLLFTVTNTPNVPGNRRIDATVPWTEINTSTSGSAGTSTSGFGNIAVESRANLRITTTSVTAPNPASVNLNQPFDVTVQIQNTGGADARNVVVGMGNGGTGASAIQPVAPLAVVPAGQTVSYSLPVVAAAGADPTETFTTTLTTAIDENSGLPSLVTLTNPPVDGTATLAIETPAVLDITNVRPSQPSVTRGQTNPWSVIVRLRNTGQSDAVLAPPAEDDLAFSLAGATKIDYAVAPPSQFGSGAAGWTLAGGATDSLIYSVVDTGNDPGTVDIALGVAGTDRNDPPRAVSDTGATTVNVQDVAGLYIESTVPVGTFNHATAERDTVNTGFAFEIHVTVQNSGGEEVDSVRVNLTRDGVSTIAPASLKRESITAGASRDFVFRVTAGPNPDILETFQAAILPGVVSHNSGQPVIPQQPVDRRHDIVIQTRANLAMNLFVASPPGSAGGVVGTSQLFTLGARVSNLGQAGVSGAAEVALTVPAGFTVQENLVRAFAPDDTVKWSVTAPAAIQSAQNFSCAITTPPNDVNTAATAFVSAAVDNQSITVSSGGALASPSIALTVPAGAVDDTLSVGQSFTVATSVTVSRVKSLVGTLTVPASFQVVGSNIHNFTNGAGTRTRNFTVNAPPNVEIADLFVTFAAVDTITGDPVPSAADTVRVTVVPRTSLAVSASVTAPPDAIDNTVATGTPFTVTATVANVAGAADIAAPGSLQITLPSLYSLAPGHTAQKPFVAGVPVSWVVNAAAQPSGPDQIAITIANVPADENSGLAAQVTTGTANIPMVTEGAAVSVRDISSAQEVGTPVAPGGATGLDVLAFQIAYNVTDTNVSPAEVDTIALTIIDKDGNALGPNVVAQTLARIAVDLGGAQPYEVASPNTNPVLVSLTSGGTDREINPDGSINAVVYLDLDASPRATELRVRVTNGMIVRDPGSGQALAVTDPQGQPLNGQVTSGPLVVLSANFEEYAHNYPNPFRAGSSQTRIAYYLDAPANVTVKIYDITGELVYEESIPSSDPRAQSGPQESTWDGRNMSGNVVRNGVYVCVLNAGSRSAKFRIAVAK